MSASSEKNKTIWWKLMHFPTLGMTGIFLLLQIIPLIYPMNIPIGVSTSTQQFYDYMYSLPEGSVVLWQSQLIMFNYGDLAPLSAATLKLLWNSPNHLKTIIIFQDPSAPIVWDNMKKTYGLTTLPPGRTYGVDYVEMGYYVGGELGWARVCDEFQAVYPTDRFGVKDSTLPIVANIKSAKDWAMVITTNSWSGLTDYMVRHAYGRYNLPTMILPSGMGAVGAMAYYPRVSPAFPIGAGAGAMLEKLQGYSSLGTYFGSAFSLMSFYTVVLCLINIVSDYMERREKK